MNIQIPEFFDTHAHFSRAGGDYSIANQIERATAAGITRIIAVGGSDELNTAAISAAKNFPNLITATIGLDRDNVSATNNLNQTISNLHTQIQNLQQNGITIAGIGEIGLDYHYSPESATEQQELFRAQLNLAAQMQLPVIVHSRNADNDTINALSEYSQTCAANSTPPGVLHCFTGNEDFARKLIDLNFYISFSGILTFRNADPLRSVAKNIPANRILIETDSPYLAPVPMRGKRNEPAFVTHVAQCLANLRSESINTIAAQTFKNATNLFTKQK